MRKKQTSVTAMGIAIVRAIESEKPEGERVCYDPYAQRFVSRFLIRMVGFFDGLGYGEIRGPGVMGFLVARERHIDEFLQSCLAGGLDQLVILGAGYDARAYRFEQLKRLRVFEVDHPATQKTKQGKVIEIFGGLPAHVTYVDVDFNTQSLAQRLAELGYNEALKTLFIWQGVTQYLTPEAVDGTLAFIANHSGAGSSVIFDYMYTSLLDGTLRHGEVDKMRGDRWMTGELLVFGIPEGSVKGFLEQRGFEQVQDANEVALQHAYMTGRSSRRKVAHGYAIASAVVRKNETGGSGG